MKKLAIFDLDGTLINTIADLAHGVNYALQRLGFPLHGEEEYRYMVGNGINKLFERALPEGERREDNVLRMREIFIPYYDIHNTDYSYPYRGISELLLSLGDDGVKMAIASNKYQSATEKIIAHYFPEIHFVVIFGQREGVEAKPNPTTIFDIIERAQVEREDVLYIGDSGIDMQTAANAGVAACGVTWGFRQRSELESFHPAYIVDSPKEIRDIIVC